MDSPTDRQPVLTGWTPATGDVLERLNARKGMRLRFLHALYEAAEGSAHNVVTMEELEARTGLRAPLSWRVQQYLHREGLLHGFTPTSFTISHQGLKEVEEALVAPARPTAHFPPAENVILIGVAEGAVIQQGNTDSVQEVELSGAKLDEARTLAADLEARVQALALADAELAQLAAEAATARAQLGAPRPRLTAVRDTVAAVRDLLEAALASGKAVSGLATAIGAASGLLALLR